MPNPDPPRLDAPTGRLQLLGQPRLQSITGTIHVLERRDAALLAALVLRGPLPRDRLITWLWPHASREAGQNNLRQRLFRLRQAAGQSLVDSTAVLNLAAGWQTDVADFAARLSAGYIGSDELLGTLDYADCGELGEWVEQERERWRTRRLLLWAECAATHEQAGRQAQALACAERWLLDDPAAEPAHRMRMRLLYLAGEPGAARVAWQRCQEALRGLLDAEPDTATRALADLIERSAATPQATRDSHIADVALQRPPHLVGRQAEWQQLRRAWSEAAIVLILGVPGMGKTRLAQDFCSSQGAVQRVAAQPSDAAVPHALLARLLHQVLPLLPPLSTRASLVLSRWMPGPAAAGAATMEAPLEPRANLDGLLEALRPWVAQGLGTLVLDDLHAADAASLELLLAWGDAAGPQRPPVVLLVRAGQVPPALQHWLLQQPAGAVLTLSLGALDAPAVEQLARGLSLPGIHAEALPELARRLWRRAGGHPAWTLELVRRLGADALLADQPAVTPTALAQAVRQRLQCLPTSALALLQLAALSQGSLSPSLATQVLTCSALDVAQDWQVLREAGLLDDSGVPCGLVREASAAAVPQPVAALLHAQIAKHLQALPTTESATPQHWEAAADWPRAAQAQMLAAEQARRESRRADELQLLDAAAANHARAGDEAARWAVAYRAVDAAQWLEPHAMAERRLDALAASATQQRQALQVLLARSRLQLNAGHGASALPLTQGATVLAAEVGDPVLQLVASAWHALALALTGDTAAGIAQLEAGARQATGVTDASAWLDHDGALGYCLHVAGRLEQALVPMRRAVLRAEALGDMAQAMEQQCNVMVCQGSLARRDEAIESGERALALWARLGRPASVTAIGTHVQLAAHSYGAGRYARAIDLLQWALGNVSGSGAVSWQVIAEHRLATIYLRLGQAARARQVLSTLPAQATVGNRIYRQMVECRLGHLAGRAVLQRLRETLQTWSAQAEPMDRFSLTLLLAAHAPADESLALSEGLIGLALEHGNPPLLVHASARRAEALRLLGRVQEAADQARLALTLPEREAALDLDHPSWCWLLWQAARAGGDRPTAQAARASGLAWIAQARPHVPPSFLESFEQRHAPVRGLLTAVWPADVSPELDLKQT